jgi:demethoxyubiquinone hydroxylase (CLK1/Coq7/Cat5 family)
MDMPTPQRTRRTDAPAGQPLTVFYDGGCPLCRSEIAFYRKRAGAEHVRWLDISDPQTPLPQEAWTGAPAPSRCDLMARFHVRDAEGHYHSGAAGFAALWRALPQFRWAGRIAGWPPITFLLEQAYRSFLRVRPRLSDALAARARDELLPSWLIADLRSDHAGETGAIFIYRGVLAVTHDPDLRRFAREHLKTESRHLELIEEVLPKRRRSKLLFLWRPAGFLTGALPALFGPAAVYRTIDAVESFVDAHYQDQIDRLDGLPAYAELRALLIEAQADEVDHRDQARTAAGPEKPGPFARAWTWAVGAGSAAAVALAKRL